MSLYREAEDAGNAWREQFLDQVDALVASERATADERRQEFFRPDTSSVRRYESSIDAYRESFKAMLGWPLAGNLPDAVPTVRYEPVADDELGSISRVWVHALPGLETYGLLFVPPGDGPHPLVIAQHGGGGTPELCSDFFGSANYNDMSRRVLRRGAAVFAPQLPLWQERFGRKPDRDRLDRQLKQLGGSIAALDVFQLRQCIRALAARPDLAPDRIGMIGLSWGGFYTLVTAAVEPMIRVAVASCFFNDRYRYDLQASEWFNAANRFLDAEIASLVCPRPLCIELGSEDELFAVAAARPGAEKVRERYTKLGLADSFLYHEHPGKHELDKGDTGINFLFHWLGE